MTRGLEQPECACARSCWFFSMYRNPTNRRNLSRPIQPNPQRCHSSDLVACHVEFVRAHVMNIFVWAPEHVFVARANISLLMLVASMGDTRSLFEYDGDGIFPEDRKPVRQPRYSGQEDRQRPGGDTGRSAPGIFKGECGNDAPIFAIEDMSRYLTEVRECSDRAFIPIAGPAR